MDDKKKPPFNPNKSFETVGTAEDAKVATVPPVVEEPKKPKFDSAKPFETVDETVKKKDTTPVSQEPGTSASETPAAQPGKPSAKSTAETTLEKRNELLNKVAQSEYDDWITKKTTEYQKILQQNPADKNKITEQFKTESQAKAKELNETFGKFGKINLSRYEKELTEEQKTKTKAVDTAMESINPIFKVPGVKDLAKTLYSGLSDQLPKEYAVQRLRLSKGDLGDIFDPRSNINQFGDKLDEWFNSKESPVKISRTEFNKWNNALPAEERVKPYDEKAEKFIIEKYGEPTLRQVQESFMGKSIAERVDFEKEIEAQNVEAKGKLAGVVQDLREVKGASDFMSFAGNMIGQALYRMPVSLATGTAGSMVAESAAIYDRQLDLIAEKEGISREEVIKQGLDKPAEGQAMAVLLGSLDAISAGNVLGMFRKAAQKQLTEGVVKKFAKEFIRSGVPEAVTEAVQTEGEEAAAASGAGVDYKPDAWRVATSAVGGLIGGGVLGSVTAATPESVIKEETIKPVTETGLEISAEAIQSKVEQNELQTTAPIEEGISATGEGKLPEVAKEETLQTEETKIQEPLKPEENAIQEPGTEEVLQRQQGEAGETGSERGGVQPVIEWQETPHEGIVTQGDSENQQKEVTPPSSGEVVLKTSLGKRIEAQETEKEITDRVKKEDDYIRRKIDLTDKEAKEFIARTNDNEHVERLIRDQSAEFNPGVRATVAANLYQDYRDKKQFEKAADIGIWAAQHLRKSGQETAIAGKIWKAILEDEDIAVIALEKQNQGVLKNIIKPVQKGVTKSKLQFDEQIRKIIEQKVTEGVEQRLEKAKLITKEKKKEISDFFDSLKIEKSKGQLNSITQVIGTELWNSSMEVVKRAVLTGADVANAIQAGIDHIKENYKGTDFNDQDYRDQLTPSLEKITKPKVKTDELDESKIKTPGIKGKKRKEFIDSVVQAYNDNTLTDEKFEELYAQKIGYKPLSSEEKNTIRELSKVISESEKFKETGREEWTKLNDHLDEVQEKGDTKEADRIRKELEGLISKHSELLKKAQLANQKMQEFARTPNNIYDTLISIIQGNLLTPLSLVTNVYSNTLLQPLRFTTAAIGGGLDMATSELAKLGLFGESYKDRTIDLVALNKGYFTGGWNGAIEGVMQVKTGAVADEKALREVQSSFNPQRAIARWAEKDRTTSQKVNDYIEGTFGIPAEVMFRLLNMGDKPFKRGAEMARAYEIGKLKGLEGNDLIGFVVFPDAESQVEIEKAGQEATFQQETELSKGVQKGIQWLLDLVSKTPYIGGVAKVILKSQVPYVKTPLNITIETIDYAIPPLTMARGIYAYSKGNRRQGNILVGKAIVGGMIIAATREMFMAGLLESDDDEKDKSKSKESRQLRYQTVPPSSINISALGRGLLLQGFERKDGDISVSFKKMGPMGILMDIHAKDMNDELKEEGKVDNSMGELFLDMFGTAPRVASSALDQSFLRGTNSFLTAIQDAGGYNTEQWVINTMGSVTSVVIPNTIATISKTSDEFQRDMYSKDFGERLKNAYMTKIFLGNKVPPKVNLWGERIKTAPEGRNKYAYYLFDVTKFQNTDTDDFRYKLYKQWKADGYNNEWIPSYPKRTITVNGFKIPLKGADYALLCEYVGKYRYARGSSLIRSGLQKETALDDLKGVYSDGMAMGKDRFLLEKGWKVLSRKQLKEMSEK
jgi:hypothetical protein